jgi:hypothetical protein
MEHDLVPIVGILFGLPAMAVSIRLVLQPLIKAFVRSRELKAGAQLDPARLDAQDARIAELEAELGTVHEQMERLASVERFYAQLQAGAAGAAGPRPLSAAEPAGAAAGRTAAPVVSPADPSRLPQPEPIRGATR